MTANKYGEPEFKLRAQTSQAITALYNAGWTVTAVTPIEHDQAEAVEIQMRKGASVDEQAGNLLVLQIVVVNLDKSKSDGS